jgi:hypothetical protein
MHKKMKRLALLISLAALALSACTIQIRTDITETGAGTWRAEMGFSPEDKTLIAGLGSTPEQFCADAAAEGDLPPGVTSSFETRADGDWCVFTQTFASLEELRTIYNNGDGILVNRLEILDGVLYYDVTVDTGSAGDFASIEEMGASIDMAWIVTFPGNVTSQNATTFEGNTFTWTLTPGTPANIQAQSSLGGFGSGAALWIVLAACCLCLLVLAGGGAAFYFIRKRKPAGETPTA